MNINTQQVDETALRKIQKCLALSRDNTNPNEAHTAMLMAQKMMAKHNLTIGEVDAEGFYDSEKPKVVKEVRVKQDRIQWWEKDLAQIVADNFRCHCYWWNGYAMGFLGLEEDAEICKEVYSFARNAMKHCTDTFMLRVSGRRAQDIKKNYMYGFINGLRDAFKEQVEKESLSLVLVIDEVVNEKHKKMKIRSVKDTSPTIDRYNLAAHEAGYEDGKTLDHRRKRLEG